MRLLLNFISKHIYLEILIVFFGFLFFFRLDWMPLNSWDEAWYASIAREIVKHNEWVFLQFNNIPFYDHPPMGFWLMATSYKIFGVSEFSTRLPSAVLGLMSIIFIYLIGKKISKENAVGFSAAMILGTCVWYVIRVRSGNLDSIFVFFYIVSIYTALLARGRMVWFLVSMLSFGSLMLTKTLVGASALPVICFILLPELINIRKNYLWILGGVALLCLLVLPWYWIQYVSYSDFVQHHFFTIGTRGKTADSFLNLQYELPLFYLHMGVRKWYYLWLASGAYLILFFRFMKKNISSLLLWNVVILYPFLTTDQTHIWHLIPVYVPIALIISFGIWDGGKLIVNYIKHFKIPLMIRFNLLHDWVVKGIYLGVIVFIVFLQVKIFYSEVIPQYRYTPDDVDISQRAGKYDSTIYLDDDYLPLAVYYSDQAVHQMAYEPEERKTLVNLFKSENEPFVAITRNWALNNLEENDLEYKILEQNDSFSIVTKPQ